MKKKLAGLLLIAVFALSASAPAYAFKFGPHDNQCQAAPDQPNCPGSH
jgi:hypothetical protein